MLEFSFEVKGSDLLGRIGTLKVGGKTIETPYMFPVIHPVHQLVTTSELKSMGFTGLMTNSYILHSKRRQEAIDKGIHSLLDFDGVFITDSGGYQVLEYGAIKIGYRDVASFQSEIGTELAVTLDKPTGYPQSRRVARETVEYSLKNARATLKEFGDEEIVWVGPIQGGLYRDLVRRSAKSLVSSGFVFLALGSPVQVMESYMFSDLVDMIMAARRGIPYPVPLHLFGAGHPLTMSLAVALGCDTFDSASYAIFARTGRYMSKNGVLTLQSMKYLPCSCSVCTKASVKDLLELSQAERTKALSIHNLYALREELEACKEAIAEGRLWDLVEERSTAHPKLRDAFAQLVGYAGDLEIGTPAMKDRGLFVRSTLDLRRPELVISARKLANATTRTSKNAAIIDTKRKLGRRSDDDPYLVHQILGPYPAELEFQYPFSQTEVARAQVQFGVEEAKRKLTALGYTRVAVGREKKLRRTAVRSRRTRRASSPSPPASSAPPR